MQMFQIKANPITQLNFDNHITVKDLHEHLGTAIAAGHQDLLVQTGMNGEWGVPVGFQVRPPRLEKNPMTKPITTLEEEIACDMLESATVGYFLLAGRLETDEIAEEEAGTGNGKTIIKVNRSQWKKAVDIMRDELNNAGLGHLIQESKAKSARVMTRKSMPKVA